MKESQQVEWKESWRDECLKWICAFANGEGGALHIGRNDRGVLVGVPVPHVTVKNLSREAIDRFRQLARQSQRLDSRLLREPTGRLVERLNLLDGRHLKRAALLLFHAAPERFITGASVKIGYFQSESELLYHDEVHGDLFTQAQGTMELLATKYLKAAISYRGIQRIETLPVPEAALREALLNAIIHRDYSVPAPIQIRVYADRLRIWNPGELPEGWSLDKLLRTHPSRPFNPSIANAFFRAGEIEAWGRGIQRIHDACRDAGAPTPRIEFESHEISIEFPFAASHLTAVAAVQVPTRPPVKTPVKTPVKILALLRENPETTLAELAALMGKSRSAVERASVKLVKAGQLRRIGPAKGGRWEVIG